MPQAKTTKTTASADQNLAYLEQIVQTKMGLNSSNHALIGRRGYADADEARRIDIQIDQNDSEQSKVSAAQTLYYTEDVTFRPPSSAELQAVRDTVRELDGIIAAQATFQSILVSTTKLFIAFDASQA